MDPAEADARDHVLRLVRAHSGVPVSKLKAMSGLGWSALYRHLAKLEEARLVRTLRSPRQVLVLAVEPGEPEEAILARAVLAKPAVAAVARAIAEGARDVPTLAARCGVAERVVYQHVKRLREQGLVASSHPTRHQNLAATPRLLRLLRAPPNPPSVPASSRTEEEKPL